MMGSNEWEDFFDSHAPAYMDNVFTKNTVQEVDFLLDELALPLGSYILDVGCGTGRHAVELARRGYGVTGIDISSGMLAEAQKAAREAGVKVELIHADATRFVLDRTFDAAICLCEGAFSLLGGQDDAIEHDLAILRNIHAVLKPGARLVLTALNGCRMIRHATQDDVESGRFDPLTMAEVSDVEYHSPQAHKTVLLRERGYVPTELVMLCRQAGFRLEHIWGGTAGNWGRRTIDLDEMEIMVVARRAAQRSDTL
jgi:cyclopropane fatty-acyl-phospholipid synthase-like methyltransferase